MANETYDIEDLIGKVLAGEANAKEHEIVRAWRLESNANENYYLDLEKIFAKAAATEVQIKFDQDAAWKKVKARINTKDNVIPINRGNVYFTPLRIAAGIVMLIGISWFVMNSKPEIETVALASTNTIITDTLPDGSTAFLNKKSELQYEFNPNEKTRKVKLKGEAFFTVKHEEEKPFVIETDEVLVRDIGTAFNLKAYPESDTIEIVVTEGEVQFYTLNNPGLNLKAGETGIYSKKLKEFYRIEKPDTNVLAYKTKVFSFNSTDLKSVVNLLNDVYNSKITLANEKLYDCKLTANFKEDNPEIIAEVIAETMGLELIKKDDELILDGKGCE